MYRRTRHLWDSFWIIHLSYMLFQGQRDQRYRQKLSLLNVLILCFSRLFFLSQWPSQFLFLFFIGLPLFFLLPLFLAQLYFLFCLSILHVPSFSIFTSKMLPVVFPHFVIVSKSLHHTMIHSTQSTSLASSWVLFSRVHRKFFSSC